MEVFALGLSHRTAPVALREKLSVAAASLPEVVRELKQSVGLEEAVLVSTCNRVEIYGTSRDPRVAQSARKWLERMAGSSEVLPCLYEYWGREAVAHAFRVCSSLDSMVLGESQILGQMKEAYSVADAAGAVGMLLGRCFSRAFAVAKRVRTETGLAAGTVSVSSIACELARKVFGDLRGRRVLLVGAGKMSESASRYLVKQGARLVVTNRSFERADELARKHDGEARPFDTLASEVAGADVVIASTASPRFVITQELMQSVQKARRHRMLLILDISVPRNVDPRVGELENVFVYDVDDLQKVSDDNLAIRRQDVGLADRIVQTEVDTFLSWQRSLVSAPTIAALHERFRKTIRAELEKSITKGSVQIDAAAMETLTQAMVNKLLHAPSTALRRSQDGGLVFAAKQLFELEETGAHSETEEQGRSGGAPRSEPANPGGRT